MAKRKKVKVPKLRPKKNPDSNVKHGVWALHELLKGDLDGRLAIVKKKNQIEADYIDHCGGKDALTPPMISLIKRIVHAELEASQAEKMSLLGEFDLTDKSYGALASRQERHIGRLEELIKNNRTRPVMSLEAYIQQVEAKAKDTTE